MTKSETLKLQKLYEIYEQPMYRIAYAVLKNTASAEDAVSEAFMRIISKIGKIGDPESPKTKSYIIKTIKNISIDSYRKYAKLYSKTQEIDETAFLIPDNSAGSDNDILSDRTEEILNELNNTDKQIMILRCSEEMSWREVAESLEMTESSVRKRFERARKKLLLKEGLCNEKEKISQ